MTKKKHPRDLLKVGRRTVMTEAVLEKLRYAFALGETDENACKYAKINPATLYNYQKDNLDFLEEKEQLKLNPILKAKNTIYRNLDDPKIAQWFLERKRKDEFSTKIEQDLSGKVLAVQKVFVTQKDNDEANKIIDDLIGEQG